MQYTTLPRTDLEVSKICLGTMTFGEQNTEAEGHEQMDYALDRGVNFFDTAELYAIPPRAATQGLTEQYIGTWFAQRKNRERVILASKIVGPSPNLTYIRKPMGFEPEMIHEAVEGSLQRLQTDYIDLYQLHWPERSTNFFGKRGYRIGKDNRWTDNFHAVLETMQDLVRAGKIRYWGLSNETPWGVNRCLHLSERHDLPRPRTVQIRTVYSTGSTRSVCPKFRCARTSDCSPTRRSAWGCCRGNTTTTPPAPKRAWCSSRKITRAI